MNLDATAFRCPADRSKVTVFGRLRTRVRSYLMNNWMGGFVYAGQIGFKLFGKLEDITRPDPASAMVMLEERKDSINDCLFAGDMTGSVADNPAYRHDGGVNLAFSDGQVRYRLWQDWRTISTRPTIPPSGLIPLDEVTSGNADLDFLRSVATAPR